MTRLFGVIGSPISHSLSPAMHAAAFTALRLDAVYGAFEVPPRLLRPMLEAFVLAGVEGLNVTVPLKEPVLRLMDRLHPSAAALGAVNTIVVRGRRMTGYNTDGAGFRRALEEDLQFQARGKRVLLLGAGGAARAVAWTLVDARVEALWIANRTEGKAKQLIRSLRRSGRLPGNHEALPLLPGAMQCFLPAADLLINATSVGLRPGDPSPVDAKWLRPGTAVMDLIYHRKTALLREARRRGCVAAGGLSMLLYQGAESFRLWLRRDPPIDAMRAALLRAMRSSEFGMRNWK